MFLEAQSREIQLLDKTQDCFCALKRIFSSGSKREKFENPSKLRNWKAKTVLQLALIFHQDQKNHAGSLTIYRHTKMTKSVSLPLVPSPSSSMNTLLQIKCLPALQELLASTASPRLAARNSTLYLHSHGQPPVGHSSSAALAKACT